MSVNHIRPVRVRSGIDNLDTVDRYLKHQKIGLLTSVAGIDHQFRPSADRIREAYQLQALFAPEHGIRGDQQAGTPVDMQLDSQTGLPVYSLYGENKAPSAEQLAGIDVFVIDLQDVGARFYTYLYSLTYCMESCARSGIPVVVLDRPNPVGGCQVEGPLLDLSCRSFVGMYPIPVRYGLTIGEFAHYINSSLQIGCNLQVATLKGWYRNLYFDQTDLAWVSPSPNIPTIDSALVYLGTCLFEATNISEGRGTTRPFELIGAPWLVQERVLANLNPSFLKGCHLRPCWYQPTNSKYQEEICAGFQIHVLDRQQFSPFAAGVALLDAIRQTHADFTFNPPSKPGMPWFIDLLSGNSCLRQDSFDLIAYLEQARADSDRFRTQNKASWLYHEFLT